MGIFRVKRNSPYLSKNNDVNNKINIMPCCVLVYVPNTKQTVTLMRKMWVRRTAELTLPYCPGFPLFVIYSTITLQPFRVIKKANDD